MVHKFNLLPAGFLVLMSVVGQNVVLAGGHHGGGGGGGGHQGGMGQSHGGQQVMHPNSSNPSMRQGDHTGNSQSSVSKTGHHGSNNPGSNSPGGSHGSGIRSGQVQTASGNGSLQHAMPGQSHFPANNQHQSFNKMHGSNWSHGNHTKGWNYGQTYDCGSFFPSKSYCYPAGCYGSASGYGCWGSYVNCYSNFGYGSGYSNYSDINCGYAPGCYGGYTATIVQPVPLTAYPSTYVTSQVPAVTAQSSQAIPLDTQLASLPPLATTVASNDYSGLLPPGPASNSLRQIDLNVADVKVVEPGTANRGPLYRVVVSNNGPMNMDVPTRIAAISIKDGKPSDDTPRVIETIKPLKVGESAEIQLRLPVAANAFAGLLIATEIPESCTDVNEQNNLAQGDVAQLLSLSVVAK
jgi:hypothetical protein